jgi:hypothetical protein
MLRFSARLAKESLEMKLVVGKEVAPLRSAFCSEE